MSLPPHEYPAGCFFSSPADIRGKRVTVMGLGLNGGGEATVKFLLKHGAYVVATDTKNAEELEPTIAAIAGDKTLDKSRLTYRLGGHRVEDFARADCVIKNPVVKYEGNRFLAAAKKIETDMSLFLAFTKSPIVAVTGSKGKSSTASAIHYGLCGAGRGAFLGGNITVSPLTFLEQTSETTPVVLELSSWQLRDLRGRKLLKPKIALITKIVSDHQNWYGGMEPYIADKRLIYAEQTRGDFAIFDAESDDAETPKPKAGGSWGDFFARESNATVLRYARHTLPSGMYGAWQATDANGNFCGLARLPEYNAPLTILRKLSMPGEHMRTNVLNAALVMLLLGIAPDETAEILGTWQGIPHRLQHFYTWKTAGATFDFYNDSSATVPEATAAALGAFDKNIILIAGGTDKGLPQNALADALVKKHNALRRVYLLAGTATDKLQLLLADTPIEYRGPYDSLDDLLKDLKRDAEHWQSGGEKESANENATVLFSPGATSFGMFANEFERGEKFMDAVKSAFC